MLIAQLSDVHVGDARHRPELLHAAMRSPGKSSPLSPATRRDSWLLNVRLPDGRFGYPSSNRSGEDSNASDVDRVTGGWPAVLLGHVRQCGRPTLGIDVLSNRADVISAGDALVEVRIPAGVSVAKVRVFDDGRDVTSAFAVRPNGRFEGLVTGLSLGPNVLTATRPRRKDATRHGHQPPQRRPGLLRPAGPALGLPGDRRRRAVQPAGELRVPLQVDTRGHVRRLRPRQARRPTSPTTTTDQGKTVPYVVRVETGYQDRDQYKIAVLYDPRKPWAAWDPQEQWNHKLLITHGASCGIEHQAGSAPDVENDAALSRGFAVMSTALNNAGHNCNIVTQAESMVMAKERLVEQYGELRYTIGTGCSGGSLDPAAGRERLPRHLPGHPARLQLPGRVVDGPAARRLPPRAPVRGGPLEVGDRRGLGPAVDRRGRGSSQPRQLDRLRHRLLDLARRSRTTAARACPPRTPTTRRPTPAACAARSPTT